MQGLVVRGLVPAGVLLCGMGQGGDQWWDSLRAACAKLSGGEEQTLESMALGGSELPLALAEG